MVAKRGIQSLYVSILRQLSISVFWGILKALWVGGGGAKIQMNIMEIIRRAPKWFQIISRKFDLNPDAWILFFRKQIYFHVNILIGFSRHLRHVLILTNLEQTWTTLYSKKIQHVWFWTTLLDTFNEYTNWILFKCEEGI